MVRSRQGRKAKSSVTLILQSMDSTSQAMAAERLQLVFDNFRVFIYLITWHIDRGNSHKKTGVVYGNGTVSGSKEFSQVRISRGRGSSNAVYKIKV